MELANPGSCPTQGSFTWISAEKYDFVQLLWVKLNQDHLGTNIAGTILDYPDYKTKNNENACEELIGKSQIISALSSDNPVLLQVDKLGTTAKPSWSKIKKSRNEAGDTRRPTRKPS